MYTYTCLLQILLIKGYTVYKVKIIKISNNLYYKCPVTSWLSQNAFEDFCQTLILTHLKLLAENRRSLWPREKWALKVFWDRTKAQYIKEKKSSTLSKPKTFCFRRHHFKCVRISHGLGKYVHYIAKKLYQKYRKNSQNSVVVKQILYLKKKRQILEQTLHQRGYRDGKEAYEKMFSTHT